MPLRIQSAFVADADRVAVVPFAVRAHLFQGTPFVDGAVARDVKVVTDVAEAPVADVVLPASFKIQAPPLGGGGAMDNKQGDGSHRSSVNARTDAERPRNGGGHRDNHFQYNAPYRLGLFVQVVCHTIKF